MNGSEFSKSLLRAAKNLDAPAAGAKARAAGQLASALATTSAVAATAAASATVGVKLAWVAAAAASISLLVVGTAAVLTSNGRPPPQATPPATATATAAPVAVDSPSAIRPETVVPAGGDANACTMHALPESAAKECSSGVGKKTPLAVVNQCNADVDVFWVDYKCEEVFHSRLEPNHTFRRGTDTSHVWRIRDHATHVLLKEFRPTLLPGAPAWDTTGDAGVQQLPDIVLTNGPTQNEVKPPLCSGVSNGRTKFAVKNERDDQITVFWIGADCDERYSERIPAKHVQSFSGHDGDAWRVRLAKTGELLLDVPPEVPDTTDVIKVP